MHLLLLQLSEKAVKSVAIKSLTTEFKLSHFQAHFLMRVFPIAAFTFVFGPIFNAGGGRYRNITQ